MAYDGVNNPLRKIADLAFVSGQSMHIYESTHDSTEIAGASFFTGVAGPGGAGVQVGDILMNVNTNTNGISLHRVTSISTSTGWNAGLHATVGAGST